MGHSSCLRHTRWPLQVPLQLPLAALQLPLAALQVPLAALQVPLAALQLPLAALQLPLAALQLPLAALQPPLAALQPPLAALQLPLAALQLPFAALQVPLAAAPHSLPGLVLLAFLLFAVSWDGSGPWSTSSYCLGWVPGIVVQFGVVAPSLRQWCPLILPHVAAVSPVVFVVAVALVPAVAGVVESFAAAPPPAPHRAYQPACLMHRIQAPGRRLRCCCCRCISSSHRQAASSCCPRKPSTVQDTPIWPLAPTCPPLDRAPSIES